MKNIALLIFILAFSLQSCNNNVIKNDYPISSLNYSKFEYKDNFWSSRLKTIREVTIPFALEKCEEEGRIRNFDRAAGILEGEYEGMMPFDDTDVYKIIEGASYSLQSDYDEVLDKYIDSIIKKIAAAQEEDGYLTTWKTIDSSKSPASWVEAGPRWHDLALSHELYNAGHMYEAAYAHYVSTGKSNFLDVALKNANLIDATFGKGKLEIPPGHQIIETGLLKLFHATGDKKYSNLAKYFLDIRGDSLTHKLYGEYSQDHIPVIKQDEAVGHAVRALYMYSAMTDIAVYMNDQKYLNAINKIWENVVSKKIYITGGTGAKRHGEAFGENYELPNLTSYNETCAAIANVCWNYRMFRYYGDSKYIDVLERTLYNGLIAGVSLEGNTFFYPNCLASDGKHKFNQGELTRKPWFNCSCCPSNIIRFMPTIPDYIYSIAGDSVYVNLYLSNEITFRINDSNIRLTQETNYPWKGKVSIKVEVENENKFNLKLRIPGWATNNPLPSDLYKYLNNTENEIDIFVNSEKVSNSIVKGYVSIDRKWKDGDIVEFDIPMNVRKVISHEKVEKNKYKVALERGPIVYCAEWLDNEVSVFDIEIGNDLEFEHKYQEDILGGISVVKSKSTKEKENFTFIPYYSWSHRGIGEMNVWFNRK